MRAYTLKEIATGYFPFITEKSASRRLRLWIHDDKELLSSLEQLGYKKSTRLFSARMVQLITDKFGGIEND